MDIRETVCLTTSHVPPEHAAIVLTIAVLSLGVMIGIRLGKRAPKEQ